MFWSGGHRSKRPSMYPSAGRALHTLGRKVGGGARAPSAPPPGSAASVRGATAWVNQSLNRGSRMLKRRTKASTLPYVPLS